MRLSHLAAGLSASALGALRAARRSGQDLVQAATTMDEVIRALDGRPGSKGFRSITLPLLLPAVVSAFLIAFTTSFDEYAVASFVVGTRVTFPLYLYGALRFPSRLPEVLAVAVVVMTVSLLVVIGAEIGHRVAERRLGSLPG